MKWKLLVFAASAFIVYLLSCSKSSSPAVTSCKGPSVDEDSSQLVKFAKDSGYAMTRDSTGLYYQILDSGTGPQPVPSSIVYAAYIGRSMSGAIIDSTSTPVAFPLSGVITGWQIGIPKIKEGGRIRLLVPSAYGYGCAGSANGTVPANACLFFDVRVTKVK